MKMHPAEITKELQSYSFFKSFTEDLLLQISTMMDEQTFSTGEEILREGQDNNSLYFLREGQAQVFLGGEAVATLERSGEVLGEMSVITGNPAATTVKALSTVKCFVIRANDFSHVQPKDKDRLQALLYRVYCTILSERLLKTNEKARLFEILNRELHEAQNALEKGNGGSVLLVEPEKKQQLPVKMALGGTGVELDIANSVEEAREFLLSKSYDVIFAEASCVDILKEAKDKNAVKFGVLLTFQDVRGNLDILRSNRYVEYIISRDSEDRNSTIRYILTTLGKLLNKELFGLDKYLAWGVESQKKAVVGSGQREELRNEMMAYFKKMGVRSSVLDRVNTVSEEMLMNAIYDAPIDSQGKSIFNHKSRKDEIVLDTHQQSQFHYGSDGMLLAVSVIDPFGGLTKDIVVDYLLSCYNGQAGSMNTQKGGAGRGLHQIIENADLTIFNVKKNVRTEVICLFNLDGQKRVAQPSFHYFFV